MAEETQSDFKETQSDFKETQSDFNKLADKMLNKSPEELADLSKVRDLANAEEVLNYANIRKKLELPSFGYFVEYCPLRVEDRLQISAIQDKDEAILTDLRNRRTVYLLLNRARPDVWTEEKVNQLASVFIDAIIMEYGAMEEDRFLLPIIKRKLDGLVSISPPKS